MDEDAKAEFEEIKKILKEILAAAKAPEIAVYKNDIIKILGWSESKYNQRNRELHDAGAIFYQQEGMPKHLRVKAFPSRLQRFLHAKSRKLYPQITEKKTR